MNVEVVREERSIVDGQLTFKSIEETSLQHVLYGTFVAMASGGQEVTADIKAASFNNIDKASFLRIENSIYSIVDKKIGMSGMINYKLKEYRKESELV